MEIIGNAIINCKIHLELNWSNYCIMSTIANTKFKTTNTKLFVPIAGIYWNEYQTKIETKNLDNTNLTRFLLDSSFQGIIQRFTNWCYKTNMLTYCIKSWKNTENLNSKIFKTKNGRFIMQSKCHVCGIKKSRFVKEQEAKGLLSSLGIKTLLSKIPLLNVLF